MSTQLRIYRRSELETVKPTIDSEGCLYRYRKIWMEGVDDSSDVSLIGIAFHAVNHAYIEKLLEAKLEQDFELAEEAFAEGVAAAQTPSRLLPQVHEVWKWHSESFELKLDRFVTAEERGGAGDVGFAPDLVYAHPERNALEIIDFKSGWQPPMTEEELKVLFQARVYCAYGAQRWKHFDRYEFTLVAVRFRKSVTVSFTPEELDAVEQEVRGAIATIEEAVRTDTFPATPGPSCRFCELACPVVDQKITYPKRLMVDQIPTVAQFVLVAEKQLSAIKKALKAAVTEHGPVMVNGMEFANRPMETVTYPVDAVLEVLRMRGVAGAFDGAAQNDLTLSKSALGKLFKAYPDLEEDLEPVRRAKTTYRFGAKIAGQDDEEE